MTETLGSFCVQIVTLDNLIFLESCMYRFFKIILPTTTGLKCCKYSSISSQYVPKIVLNCFMKREKIVTSYNKKQNKIIHIL